MSTDASPDYTIRARIVADDATATGADSAQRRLREVENQATRSGLSMSGMFTRAFALIGGATGIGFAIRGMVGLNSEIQTSRNGLATLFNALSGMPIARSIGLARSEMKALQADAARGVGELSDYSQAYQMLLSPGLGAGKNLGQIRELVRNSLAAGSAMRGQEGLRLMPMDLVQAMSGQVGMRTTPMVAQALAAANISLEKFRAMKPAEQFDALNTAFGKFAPGVALMGRSWDAQFSTLRDNTKQLIRDVTGPLFDKWTTDLIKVNDWMEKNRDVISSTAHTWGRRLISMWDTLIARAGTYAAILAATRAAPMIGRGSAIAAGASKVWGYLGGGMGAAGAAEGAVGASGLSALGSSMAALAIPAGLAAGAFLSIRGAIREFPESLSSVTAGFGDMARSLSRLGDALDRTTVEGSPLNRIGKFMLDFVANAEKATAGFLRVMTALLDGITGVAKGVGAIVNAIFQAQHGDVGPMKDLLSGGLDKITTDARRQMYDDLFPRTRFGTRHGGQAKDVDADELNKLKIPHNITNIGTLNLNVKTEINADPDRVMMAVGEGLDKLRVYAKQGRRLPVLGV